MHTQATSNSCCASNRHTGSVLLPFHLTWPFAWTWPRQCSGRMWLTSTAGPASEASCLAPLETLSWDLAAVSRGPSWLIWVGKFLLWASPPMRHLGKKQPDGNSVIPAWVSPAKRSAGRARESQFFINRRMNRWNDCHFKPQNFGSSYSAEINHPPRAGGIQ